MEPSSESVEAGTDPDRRPSLSDCAVSLATRRRCRKIRTLVRILGLRVGQFAQCRELIAVMD